MTRPKPETADEFIRRHPCITSHIVAESLSYAPPLRAAQIGLDGMNGDPNWCEWIYSCYGTDARKALQSSIERRHYHKGYMAEYKHAKALVDRYINEGKQPMFASWF